MVVLKLPRKGNPNGDFICYESLRSDKVNPAKLSLNGEEIKKSVFVGQCQITATR